MAVVKQAVLPALAEAMPEDDVVPSTLSAYRLAIARQARQYKFYPPMARQRGVAGEVGVMLLAGPGGAPLQVRLERSSGDASLDAAALSIIGQAMRSAPVPAELRGRRWQISLPLQFALDG